MFCRLKFRPNRSGFRSPSQASTFARQAYDVRPTLLFRRRIGTPRLPSHATRRRDFVVGTGEAQRGARSQRRNHPCACGQEHAVACPARSAVAWWSRPWAAFCAAVCCVQTRGDISIPAASHVLCRAVTHGCIAAARRSGSPRRGATRRSRQGLGVSPENGRGISQTYFSR